MFSRLRVFSYVIRRFSTRIHIPTDEKGNTPLHYAIEHCFDAAGFESTINQFGREAAAAMSKTLNHRGELPVDRLSMGSLSTLGYQSKLFSLMKPTEILPLGRPLSVEAVLREHDIPNKASLTKHLVAACDLVNQVRAKIPYSTSYPWFDPYLPASEAIMDKLVKLRDASTPIRSETTGKFSLTQHYMMNKAKLTIRYGVGNCEEFSCVALSLLHTQPFLGFRGEFAAIEPGDHAFVVLGREPLSKKNNVLTWGESAVVCDPWMGQVYPAVKFQTHARDYRYYDDPVRQETWRVLPYFNPGYQRFNIFSERVFGGGGSRRDGRLTPEPHDPTLYRP